MKPAPQLSCVRLAMPPVGLAWVQRPLVPVAALPSSEHKSAPPAHVSAWMGTTSLLKQGFACFATRVAPLAPMVHNAQPAILRLSCTHLTQAIYVHVPTSHTSTQPKASAYPATLNVKPASKLRQHTAPVVMWVDLSSTMTVPACLTISTPEPQAHALHAITVASHVTA